MINPKDIINKLSVEELCQAAEHYFKTAAEANPRHFMTKPFSSLIETPEILLNMGSLLSGLRLGKTMKILDFGAGSCWFSRYLNQVQCQTISCEPSKTALELGKRLFEEFPIFGDYIAEPVFLQFDGRKINLPDDSVDRIICYDAFHHVPNQSEVLSEFYRVLVNGGIAGFSEPSRYHSQSPKSQSEMKNYNFLENDVNLNDIYNMAKEKGFTDISCKLSSNIELSLDQYINFTDDKANKFLSALQSKMDGKVLNNIRQVTTDKSIFFLYKGDFIYDSRSHVGLSHTIESDGNSFSVKKGESLKLDLKICNSGEAKWLHENIKDIGIVRVGTHLYDKDDKLITFDNSRHALTRPILPGETFTKTITLTFPDYGIFRLAIDLVSEEVSWFEDFGSKPLFITVDVVR